MAGRVVLFGATGYTGRLIAEVMVRRGIRPLLAGRSRGRLEGLAAQLGGDRLDVAVADATEPRSIRRLLRRGDVLVTTVGPFQRWGEAAVRAAIEARAHYLDSTGEPLFIRRIFEEWGLAARGRCGLLTAFGYDYVPGNLAAGLALREAGPRATRVEIGYFVTGGGFGMSGGTRASAAGIVLDPHHSWRGGRLRLERVAVRVRRFETSGGSRMGVSIGSTEAYALPRIQPALLDVDVYLGWFGPLARPLQGLSLSISLLGRVPGARRAARAAAARLVTGSSGGPTEAERQGSGSSVIAVASEGSTTLATVRLDGGNAYALTAGILAGGAEAAAEGGLLGSGALGPADGFGLDALERLCSAAGLERRGPHRRSGAGSRR